MLEAYLQEPFPLDDVFDLVVRGGTCPCEPLVLEGFVTLPLAPGSCPLLLSILVIWTCKCPWVRVYKDVYRDILQLDLDVEFLDAMAVGGKLYDLGGI